MSKNTLIAIIILVLLIILGIGGYFYYTKSTPEITSAPTAEFPGDGMPITGQPTTDTTGQTQGSQDLPEQDPQLPRLYELHKLPVAGIGFIEATRGSARVVTARYIERGLGHIFETPMDTLTEARISNETRTQISEAIWGNSGKSVVIRFVDDKDGPSIIKSRILNIGALSLGTNATSTTSSFAKIDEIKLPDYIPFLSVAEDGSDKLFYLEEGIDVARGSVSTYKNTSISTIFNSSFTEWLPQFPNQQLVTLTSKPSAGVQGHLFFVNPGTKSVTKILGKINGLTTLTNKDGKLVLFSETKNGVPELSVYDVTKKTSRPLLLESLADKCAWGTKNKSTVYCAIPERIPSASYPDQWYQGIVTFSDSIWEIDAITGDIHKIMTPSEFGATPLDIINIAVSSDSSYLIFMNKVTGTPWSYRITNEVAPSAQPVNTTSIQTEPIKTLDTETIMPTSGMRQLQ